MQCSECGSSTTVTQTRSNAKGLYRRRFCSNPECNHRLSTQEVDLTFWEVVRVEGQISKSLVELSLKLVTKHIQVQTILENLDDGDLDSLFKNLFADYQALEDEFLAIAQKIGQRFYSVDYHGTAFVITCCEAFEDIQIDHLTQLEAT